MIANSSEFMFWPEIHQNLGGGCIRRGSLWPDTYEGWWGEEGDLIQDGENITQAEINGMISEYGGGIPGIPGGYLRADNEAVGMILGPPPYYVAAAAVIGTAFPPGLTLDELAYALTGYMVWQGYRVSLAMQAVKMLEFHRRGRPTLED